MPRVLTKKGWVLEYVTLQARSGEWWVGTGEGLYRFSAAANFTQIKTARPLAVYKTAEGLASPQVYRLFEDSTGAIWVSTISPNGLALAKSERKVAASRKHTRHAVVERRAGVVVWRRRFRAYLDRI